MNHKIAQNLIAMNRSSYNELALVFSQTRQHSWPDFKVFEPYLTEQTQKLGRTLNILDIGCGNGRLTTFLDDYINSYTGVDISSDLLQLAQKKYPSHTFICEDLLNLDKSFQAGQKFDAIFMIASLNHIPKEFQMQAMANISNLLNPNGILYMTNWNLWQASYKRKSVYRSIRERLQPRRKYGDEVYDRIKEYNIPLYKLRLQDVMTLWHGPESTHPLYYYAFKKKNIQQLCASHQLRLLHNEYSQKTPLKAGNLISIAQKYEY